MCTHLTTRILSLEYGGRRGLTQVELWGVISLKATFRLRAYMQFTCLDMMRDLHVITVEDKNQHIYDFVGTDHKN